MREAQKMMQDPAFQAHMKKVMANSGFQQSMKKAQTAMKDPKKLKEMEAKAEAAIADGNKQLEEVEKLRQKKTDDEGKDEAEKEEDKTEEKPDAKKPADKEDEVPDIPSLSLN